MRPPPGFRKVYGSHPFHLALMAAGFALLAYTVHLLTPSGLWNPHTWWRSIAVWFAAAIIAHDLIAFPVYALADRLLRLRRNPSSDARAFALNCVRLPALASALTFFVFLPGIIRQGSRTYFAATGQTQEPFLGRWLWLVAAFFALGALAYVLRWGIRARRSADGSR